MSNSISRKRIFKLLIFYRLQPCTTGQKTCGVVIQVALMSRFQFFFLNFLLANCQIEDVVPIKEKRTINTMCGVVDIDEDYISNLTAKNRQINLPSKQAKKKKYQKIVSYKLYEDHDSSHTISNDNSLDLLSSNAHSLFVLLSLTIISLAAVVSSMLFIPMSVMVFASMASGVTRWVRMFMSFWFGYGLYYLGSSAVFSFVSIVLMMIVITLLSPNNEKSGKAWMNVPMFLDLENKKKYDEDESDNMAVKYDYDIDQSISLSVPLIEFPGVFSMDFNLLSLRIIGKFFLKLGSQSCNLPASLSGMMGQAAHPLKDFYDVSFYFENIDDFYARSSHSDKSNLFKWIMSIQPLKREIKQRINKEIRPHERRRFLLSDNMTFLCSIPEDRNDQSIQDIVSSLQKCQECNSFYIDGCDHCQRSKSDLVGGEKLCQYIIGRFLKTLRAR